MVAGAVEDTVPGVLFVTVVEPPRRGTLGDKEKLERAGRCCGWGSGCPGCVEGRSKDVWLGGCNAGRASGGMEK